MKLAINKTFIGKPESFEDKRDMTFSYENVDINQNEFVKLIDAGYSFSAQHKNKHRKSGNFICSDFIAVDIDNGLTLDTALSDNFIKEYGSIIYTSESHTEENHRFRIIFETEKTITSSKDMKNAYTGLIKKIGGDKSCTDACRQFYGSSKPNTNLLGNVMPESVLQEIIILGEESLHQRDTADSRKSNGKVSIVSRTSLDPEQLVKLPNGDMESLARLSERTSIYCPIHIDNNPSAFVVKSKKGVNGVHCSSCQTTYFSNIDMPLYDFNYGLRNITDMTLEEFESIEEGEYLTYKDSNIIKLNEKYLPNIKTKTALTLIRSPKGSGKTQWLEGIIKQHKKEWVFKKGSYKRQFHPDGMLSETKRSILLIGHRQMLVQSVAIRLGLTSYSETVNMERNGKLVSELRKNPPERHYAICVDSLSTLLNPKQNHYDIVLIDEVEQVLSHLTSDTVKDKRIETFLYFKHYIDQAEKVYVLDADLNQLTVNTLYDLVSDTSKSVTFITNDNTVKDKELYLYKNKQHLTDELIKAIERGERCFVCTNSKKQVSRLVEYIEERFSETKKVLGITADNSQDVNIQKFIRSIKSEILKYDVVIVSPTVGTGVDITFPYNESHIDNVFGFFEARVTTHFDIDQQISRVRHPKSIKVWISPETFRFSIDSEIIKAEIIDRDRSVRKLTGIKPDGTRQYDYNEEYLNLYSNVTAMTRGSKNNLRYHFRKLKEYYGWKVVEIERNEQSSKSGLAIHRRGSELYEEERVRKIVNAKIITKKEYGFLIKRKKKYSLSPEEEDAMRRYEIESFYQSPISEESVKKDKNGKLRQQIRNYTLYVTHESDLLVRDVIDNKYNPYMTDKKNLSIKSNLFYELLSSANLADEENRIITEKLIDMDSLVEFTKCCKKNKERIAQMLQVDIRKDIEKKPTQQLSQILKLIGISWTKCKPQKRNGSKVYRYLIKQEVIDELNEIVDRRQDRQATKKWLTEREQIQENRLFTDDQSIVNQISDQMDSVSKK